MGKGPRSRTGARRAAGRAGAAGAGLLSRRDPVDVDDTARVRDRILAPTAEQHHRAGDQQRDFVALLVDRSDEAIDRRADLCGVFGQPFRVGVVEVPVIGVDPADADRRGAAEVAIER